MAGLTADVPSYQTLIGTAGKTDIINSIRHFRLGTDRHVLEHLVVALLA